MPQGESVSRSTPTASRKFTVVAKNLVHAARRGVGGGGACPLGNYRVLGRVDDMLNVSGHLISTTQVEASLMAHPRVTEASVVAVPHAVKGQSLNAFVVLASSSSRLEQEDESTTLISHHQQQQQNYDAAASAAVIRQLEAKVRAKVGGLAVPDAIFLVPLLPLTRSGKVLKRILAKVATAQISDDDISSSSNSISQADTDLLADPSVLPTLTKAIRRQRRQINHTTFLGNK